MTDEKLPILKPEELSKTLKKMGFFCVKRQPLSIQACRWQKDHVPGQRGKASARGLLRKILRDVDVSAEELKTFL
jgi:predicted RNA binding protein YcfA (HicA-like mRNA interferase family)